MRPGGEKEHEENICGEENATGSSGPAAEHRDLP